MGTAGTPLALDSLQSKTVIMKRREDDGVFFIRSVPPSPLTPHPLPIPSGARGGPEDGVPGWATEARGSRGLQARAGTDHKP